jgi:hypothetical protein
VDSHRHEISTLFPPRIALFLHCFQCELSPCTERLGCSWAGCRFIDFENPSIVPARQLLAALVDVLPAGAAADAEEMTDRDCHVATAVNGQVSGRPVFCDQRSDEPLITATDGTFTLIARRAD